jgi:hypothetical protein
MADFFVGTVCVHPVEHISDDSNIKSRIFMFRVFLFINILSNVKFNFYNKPGAIYAFYGDEFCKFVKVLKMITNP